MTQTHRLTALIEREGSGYVALCPELAVASQGDSVEQARRILEVHGDELRIGTLQSIIRQSQLPRALFEES